ncbi:MAG: hypothetical protein KR126chlam1_00697 [Chlamydiae bacterium]|nr:hypothetical protein [Chlamydiota bacterium]
MRFFFTFTFLGLFLSSKLSASDPSSVEKPFVIVIPSYNDTDSYKDTLQSVFQQNYQNYRILYIADAPQIDTTNAVQSFIEQKSQKKRCILMRTGEKDGPLACISQAIFSCDQSEIILVLNTGDSLGDPDVLSYLNALYADSNVWATYRTNQNPTKSTLIPDDVNQLRLTQNTSFHLDTFYASLFQKVDKDDFLWKENFFSNAADLAFTFPILEMAGTHSRFVPEILFTSNDYSSCENLHSTSKDFELEMNFLTKVKKPYTPLSSLPDSGLSIPSIFQVIKDPLHPTLNDYLTIQSFLSYGERENLHRLADYQYITRTFKIIGNTPEEYPSSEIIPVNCSINDKENCILIYSSFNRNYPFGLQRLVDYILQSDFKGHIFFRKGGWPNAEGGSLKLAHVPYAFKAAFFKESQRLGYKRTLWLDTSITPLVSLNRIFDRIDKAGYFSIGTVIPLGLHMHRKAAAYFGKTMQQTKKIYSYGSMILGVDFTKPIGNNIIDLWYNAAKDPDAYFNPRPDQVPLSLILYQLGLTPSIDLAKVAHWRGEITPDSLFLIERRSVHYK